ncbi:MAG: NB-ARC domain-containing protein [Cyanobacteria bacterium P01_G01_bin.54]
MSRDALIIGINRYAHSALQDMSFPANDAEAIAQLLEQYGQFDTLKRFPEVIKDGELRINPKGTVRRRELRAAIAQRLNPPTDQQRPHTVLIYFSGHGWQSQISPTDGYLATSDSDPVEDIGIELQWLKNQLEHSPIPEQIVWLDCCNSGTLLNFGLDQSARQNNVKRFLITSSRDFEASFNEVKHLNYSALTHALLEGLDPTKTEQSKVTSTSLIYHLEHHFQGQHQIPSWNDASRPILLTMGTPQAAPAQPPIAPKSYVPLQMPPLPEHFVERPEHQDPVKNLLLTDDPKISGTLVVSAIYGLGGIGKSVLAAKLAHDPAIQNHFTDGILWVTLGQNPDLLPLLSNWLPALGDYDYKPTNLAAASAHLRTLLYDKQALLVVDDVWNPEHLEPFRVGGTRCSVLVTTRAAKILDAHRYDLDVMSAEQALALMTQKLSEPLLAEEKEQALTFAERVGYLPLALELAASQVEEGVTWAELLADFQAEVARLESLDYLERDELPDEAQRRKYSLLACFNLSLRQLSPEQLNQFAWLGIVPEDINLTPAMAATLWQVSLRQAGAILRNFRSKTLLLPGAKQRGNKSTYRLHDLMHDLAQRLLVSPVEPTQAGELPGLGLTKAAAHGEFLDRYRAQTVGGQWHTLPDDGYIYAHLTWHLEQAGQRSAVHQLFLETNERGKQGWYGACEAIGKPAGFVNDLGRGWRLAVAQYAQDPAGTLVQLWRYGLIRTSLNSMASNAPAELVAALVEKGVWQPAQGLAYAQQMQDPWRRAECIGLLVPFFPEGLVPEVKQTIDQIKEPAYRSFVLAKLADRFPEFWREVLAVVAKISDRQRRQSAVNDDQGFLSRAKALSQLIKRLPLNLRSEALGVTRQINNEFDRASTLVELAKQQPELMSEALEVTRQINNESDRASALIELAKQQPELMSEALEVTRQINNESDRASVLIELVEHLPPELMTEALEVTHQINSESDRARALSVLAQLLPELMPEALEVTRKITDEIQQLMPLIKLVDHLPLELVSDALEITKQISNEFSRSLALSLLAQPLPLELMSEVLEVIRQINDDSAQSSALIAFLEYLPPELIPEALAITRQINDASAQARALITLAQQQPELIPETLEVTRQINSEFERARALIALAQQQPELILEALEVTRQIDGKFFRSSILIKLVEYLPSELIPETLEITHKINDESDQASALIELAKQLPKLLTEALLITRKINSESDRARALRELAKQKPELMSEALEVTSQINSESNRFLALIILVKHLSPELIPEALTVTRQISDKYYRASALIELAKQKPELILEALEVTCQIKNESGRAIALSELAEYLPSELTPEVLAAIHQINGGFQQARAMSTLVESLPPELISEALEVTRQISDESDQVSALITLAAHQPELIREALEITHQINNESDQARTLSALVKCLPLELMPEALEITCQINNESDRVSALSALVEHLPLELMSEALEVARQINNESDRAIALNTLAKKLPELIPEALEGIRQINGGFQQVSTLRELAPHLPLELMPQALEVTHQINNESSEFNALSALVKHLPLDLMSEALEVTCQINNESDRASALRELTQHLPLELLSETLEVTCQINSESDRARTLGELAQHLPAKLLPKLVKTITTFQDPYYCALVWGGEQSWGQGALSRWEELQPQFLEVAHVLEILTHRERGDFISSLPHLKPIFERLGGEAVLMDCVAAMREVCEQF